MDLLKTDITKLYRGYLVPSLSAAIVTSVYSFVDMIAIGRGVGPDGAAALSIATPIFGVVSFFGLLCGVGSSIYLGKARGEGRIEKSNAYFSTSLLLTILFTVLVWAGFNLFSTQIYILFGAKETLMPFIKSYTDLIVWTMPLFILSSYLSCVVRSDGAPNKVMAAVIIGGIFNIFGDWFFVFPMDWGMFGAALATVLRTVMQFVILCSHFFSKSCCLKLVKPFRPSRAIHNVLLAGFSAGVIDIAFIVLTVILNKQILRYGGEAALAVFGVVITCSSMFQHLFSGVGQAIQPIVSMNFGAGQFDRIRKIDKLSAITALLMGVAFSLIGLLFPTQITAFFLDATPKILEIAPGIIRVYFLSYLPMGINIQATYYLQAVMRTTASNTLALLRGLLFSGTLVYLLPLRWGADGIWWAMAITEFAVVIFSIFCLRAVDRSQMAEGRI